MAYAGRIALERLPDEVTAVGMGSCQLVLGECVQGRLRGGRHFLITSPIGLFSWAEFVQDLTLGRVVVDPPQYTKSMRAVARWLSEERLPASGLLRVYTPLDPGQGFGTSTADITASLRAAAAAWGRTVEPERVARLAIEIEPSDGSMYPGCVAFAHREGVVVEHLGVLPAFTAVVACTGGIVDTVTFDERRRDYRYDLADENDLVMAWAMVRQANRLHDAGLLARATTISARINEQLLAKPHFDEVLSFVSLSGMDGVMAAHSGTALAIVLDPARPGFHARLEQARRFVDGLGVPEWFQVSNATVALQAGTVAGSSTGRARVAALAGLAYPLAAGSRPAVGAVHP